VPAGSEASGRGRTIQRAASALGVAADQRLARVLLAAAAEEVERSPAFAERVRALLSPTVDQAAVPPAARRTRLLPVSRITEAELDPFAPPDPRYLLRLYGAAQLPAALAEYSYVMLRAAAKRLFGGELESSARLPRSKAALIEALVERVTSETG
jgi:hypothetical protein